MSCGRSYQKEVSEMAKVQLRNVDLITVRFAAWRFCSYVLKKTFA